MQKERNSFRYFSVSSTIFLLVLSIISISFIIGQTNIVSAEAAAPPATTNLPIGSGSASVIQAKELSEAATVANAEVVKAEAALKAAQGAGDTAAAEQAQIALDAAKATATTASQAAGAATPYSYKLPFLGTEFVGGWAHLAEGAIWAGILYGGIKLVAPLLGADKYLTDALSTAALAGVFTYKGLLALGSKTGEVGFGLLKPDNFLVNNAGLIGIGVAVAVFIIMYKKESQKVMTFQCLPWEAPLGGNQCETCNSDPFRPCSEYRCKSLGQACDLVNKGTSEERCVWVSKGDVNSPTISTWNEPLTEGHKYVPDATRPADLGAKIVNTQSSNGCTQAFTPLQFGVLTNEPAQCKIDYVHTENYSDMEFYFGETNYYLYNHTQKMSLPSPDSLNTEAPELQNDGQYTLYIRCQDANGNWNVDEFALSFCVDPSPDTTPPVIESTSILSGSPVSFGSDVVPVSFYVNEPAQCKWSTQDKAYDDMENSMSCSTSIYQQNSNQLYPCVANLTGIKNQQTNQFFVRCEDQPKKAVSERNVNSQSYPFVLKGTQSLIIDNVGPNQTVVGSTDAVSVNLTVETQLGAEEGKAICYFGTSPDSDSLVQMFQTNSHEHKQILSLASGSYTYYFRCVDQGGNSAENYTSFSVEADKQPPMATRIYKEGVDTLKLVTNEDAQCAYSLNNCNFNFAEGVKMLQPVGTEENNHFAQWNPSLTYYIRCQDKFLNEPIAGSCTIVASATNVQ